jgi:hypothetical protein
MGLAPQGSANYEKNVHKYGLSKQATQTLENSRPQMRETPQKYASPIKKQSLRQSSSITNEYKSEPVKNAPIINKQSKYLEMI